MKKTIDVSKQLKKVGAEIGDKAEIFKKEAKKNLKEANEQLKEATKKVNSYMKKNPAKAAAIAAGIGAIIGAGVGAILGGRRKRR